MADEYERFLQRHEYQLFLTGIPKHFHRRFFEKMSKEIFDSGEFFQLCPVDDDDEELSEKYNPERRYYVSTLENVVLDPLNDENAIFLIDHAWTYRIKDARANLKEIPNLYERMASLMNVDSESKDDGIEFILQRMWKFNQTYTMTSSQIDPQRDCEEAFEPFWFIMDELGSSIRHSDTNANVCCTSFFFEPSQTMFSLFYPIVRIDQPFTEIFRNYSNETKNELERQIRLLPWQRIADRKTILRNLNIEIVPELFQKKLHEQIEVYEKCHKNDLFDNENLFQEKSIDKEKIWKVFTDHELVEQFLKDPHFQLVDRPENAEILFVMKQWNDFRHQTLGDVLINQFPYENIVTNKELLALISRRSKMLNHSDRYVEAQETPVWLTTTFNLNYELPQFAVYFQFREDQHLDNTWIVKPTNLTRSIDMTVTNLLDTIVRLPESGPKIVCKYVSNPLLLKIPEIEGQGVKFDVRYVLLLRQIRPLKLFVHKIFWLRFANKTYSLNELDDYETHFTVMNYRPNAFLRQMNCQTFISMFNAQHAERFADWTKIEAKIFEMFRDVFHCATIENAPLGIASSNSSRALYAADLMLEIENDQIQPKLLEINFTPDCHRACEFYPNFFDQIFNVLFRDVVDGQDVIDISE